MAIDSPAKRQSAIATRRLPWFRRFSVPVPDGTIDDADRQQLGMAYRGIAVGEPDPGPLSSESPAAKLLAIGVI